MFYRQGVSGAGHHGLTVRSRVEVVGKEGLELAFYRVQGKNWKDAYATENIMKQENVPTENVLVITGDIIIIGLYFFSFADDVLF